MEIKFKEVTPELRMNHLDLISNHEELIKKERNQWAFIGCSLVLLAVVVFYWQKKYYEKKIAAIIEENKAKNNVAQ